ncbi:MAG: ribonuclease HII [Chlamydiales bacterium]
MPYPLPEVLPPSEQKRLLKLVELEKRVREQGYRHIAGIDEAGRGPLAGPVVASACVIEEGHLFEGVNDSKLLSASRRNALFQQLIQHNHVCYAVGIVDSETIDEINILQATLKAMREAVAKLAFKPDYLLVDGLHLEMESIPSEKIVQGDRRCQSIAAASIIAKEVRDEIMKKYHLQYPRYRFDENKGYGTLKHRQALEKYGPCPIHRRTFSPVSSLVK